MENGKEKELAQKSCKGHTKQQKLAKSMKAQKTVKYKKWIQAKKAEAFRAKNLDQLRSFLISGTRKTFTN